MTPLKLLGEEGSCLQSHMGYRLTVLPTARNVYIIAGNGVPKSNVVNDLFVFMPSSKLKISSYYLLWSVHILILNNACISLRDSKKLC